MPPSSPYYSSGRRSTDDLFAASSLIDQNQLPDWLNPRAPQQRPAAPPGGSGPLRRSSGPLGGPRSSPLDRRDPDRDAHLPDWLRAMDPGAPPDLSNLNSGPLRGGGRAPAPQYRPPAPERPGAGGRASASDPFNLGRGEVPLPPMEGFDRSGAPLSSAPGHPTTGRPDPFGSGSPFSQPLGQSPFSQVSNQSPFGQPSGQLPFNQPSRSRPRPDDSLSGATWSQGFPESEVQQPGAAGPAGTWRSEGRTPQPGPQAAGGLPASSLVDKTALPDWMRELEQSENALSRTMGQNPPAGARPFEAARANNDPLKPAGQPAAGGLPSAGASPFDAAALVDEAALPDWLRSSRETEPLPLPFTVSESVGSMNLGREKKSAERADAADDDALPDWLQQVYSEAHVPPLYEDKPPLSAGPKQISGSDLLDRRAVPTWLKEAAQTSPLDNISDILASTPPAEQPESLAPAAKERPSSASAGNPDAEPISGNSLVDAESLPEWMRNLSDDSPLKGISGSGLGADAAPSGSASGFFSASELVDTAALPTWMQAQEPPASSEASARPTDPPAPSGSASGVFSASELVDTHALPTWLKAQEPQGASEPVTGQAQPVPSDSPSGLMSAAELVDTQALPAWLKAQGTPSESASDAPAGAASQSAPSGSASGLMSAAELVDTAALPAWLKAQEPPASPMPGRLSDSGVFEARPSSSKITPMPVGFSSQQSGAFSAAELVDTKALPTWLKSSGSESGSPSAQAGQDAPSASSSGMMASELVDTGALPVWLKGAESSPGASGSIATPAFASRNAPPTASSDQTGGFSAASLVDPEALPDWLRPAQSSASDRSGSGADWGDSFHAEQGNFSAASLINPSDLPDWLQSREGVQRPGAQPVEGAEGEETPQARVPHRPRLSNEPDRAPSQAAAHVFSSVLGPTAGEDQRSSGPLGGHASVSREMPALDRGNPFGQLSAQAPGWEDAGPGGWNQPPLSPRQGEASGDWSGSFGGRSMLDDPLERSRPGYRPLGPLSEGQRGRQAFPPPEPEEGNIPPGRQPKRPAADARYEMAEDQQQDLYGQRGFGEYASSRQERGAPERGGYPQQYGGWEGGPDYDPGFAGDDDVGPPSGMFAKLKRMLGFGR